MATTTTVRQSIEASRATLARDDRPPSGPRYGAGSGICESCGSDLVVGFLVRFAGAVAFEVCGRCLPDLDGSYDISQAVS